VTGFGVRASLDRVAAKRARFPPFQFARLVLEHRSARLTPTRASSPSVALRPCVAARSPMSGASYRRRRRPEGGRSSNPQGRMSSTGVRVPGRVVRRVRTRAAARTLIVLHTAVLIATFHRVAGDGGARASSASLRVPGRVVRRGRAVAGRPRAAARSPMSGASSW
jgi:hypothetical protein